jgi:hypothetical protein
MSLQLSETPASCQRCWLKIQNSLNILSSGSSDLVYNQKYNQTEHHEQCYTHIQKSHSDDWITFLWFCLLTFDFTELHFA